VLGGKIRLSVDFLSFICFSYLCLECSNFKCSYFVYLMYIYCNHSLLSNASYIIILKCINDFGEEGTGRAEAAGKGERRREDSGEERRAGGIGKGGGQWGKAGGRK